VRATRLAGDDIVAISLICTGMLPPSFIEYALRDGAAGVLVSGCREAACEFRLGQRWAAERLQGLREPHLRAAVARERLTVAWAQAGEDDTLHAALDGLRARVQALGMPARLAAENRHG
jgi:coenzyme F420-reducing hydrogenase delta subunit